MINLLQLSFFSQYAHAPQTWLHFISTKKKILILTIYLISVPHLSMSLLTLETLLILSIFLAFSLNLHEIYKFLSRIMSYLVIFFIFSSITLTTTDYTIVAIPYHILLKYSHVLLSLKKATYNNIIIFFIPTLISRSFLILTSYYLYHQLMTLTTQTEKLLVNNLFSLSYINPYILRRKLVFILILACEYIYIIEIKIQDIMTSVSMRGQSLNRQGYKEIITQFIVIFSIIKWQLMYEIDDTNQIIYTRDILICHRDKWLIS